MHFERFKAFNNNKSKLMGSCFSDPVITNKRIPKNTYNPIQGIIDKFSIESLNEQWDRNELKTIEGKVSTLVNVSISFDRFLEIFPKLLNFSHETRRKYFRLFAFEGNEEISKKELIQALTIVKKVAENRHLAPLIFFVYTKELKHRFMSEEELKLFEEENKAYAKNLENIDEEVEILLQDNSLNASPVQQKKVLKQNEPQSKSSATVQTEKQDPQADAKTKQMITLPQFVTIFENYNLQSYQILFSWNLAEQEKELVDFVSKEGISRKKGDKVYLVQYQWFLSWKLYAQREYQTRIEYKEEETDVNYISIKNNSRRKSKEDIKVNDFSKVQKPGEIKNYILKYGKKDNELIDNLVEFNNFICVKEEVWSKLVAIYNGGPAIERIYPKIYYNVIIKVSVNEKGRFIHRSTKKIESRQRPTVSGYASAEELQFSCYYKYPGKKNWTSLKNLSTKSEEIFNSPRTYLTFVPKTAENWFIHEYNIQQGKQTRYLKERFKNYGTQINFSIEGVLSRGEVIEIEDQGHVTIEYVDENGKNHRKILEYDDNFQKFNPENLSQENQINQLSGLDNIGNTCYMNAVIQCLIRTPFFGSYLEQENFTDRKEKQELLIEEISKIYMKSKTSNHESINTKSFKRVFEKHCPYFQGNSQHDSQQFLICLLERLMQEIKIKREEYGVKEVVNKQKSSQEDKGMNKKVVKFFSGKTQAVTTCKKCKNKGVRIESFFTYSLSLPEQPVVEFYYQYIPFYRKESAKSAVPLQCGITLNRKVTVSEFIEAIAKEKKTTPAQLALYTVFNNEILSKLESTSFYKQISYYLHFNAKIVCYEVRCEDSPTFYDFQRRRLGNKSIKIELRQRIYSQKTSEYKVIYLPYIIEITEDMYWKDVVEDIKMILSKLERKQGDNLLESFSPSNMINESSLGVSEIKVVTHIKHSNSMDEPSPFSSKFAKSAIQNPRHTVVNQTPEKSTARLKQSYSIRVIKSDHLYQNSCIFCKEQFVPHKRGSKKICKGCYFNDDYVLFEQSQFRNICDSFIITVDWQESIPEFQKSVKDVSFDISLQKSESRKDKLQELLVHNFNNSQQLQLKCEKEACQYNIATRMERIKVYPNILLLHLKRFTYEDNMLVKLTNSVIYPETIQLSESQSVKYELYGVVSHIGSGVGGHYISFVKVSSKWYKCDDSRVTFANPNQHIDPNAYLLFYKKIDFQPSLMTLSF